VFNGRVRAPRRKTGGGIGRRLGGRLAQMKKTARKISLNAVLSARGVGIAAALYCALNAAITLSTGPALALDDVKLNVLTQSLEGGYLPDNPPLFEWTLIAIQQWAGPSLASFVVAKYLFFCLGAAFTYLAARAASGEARTGAIAAFLLPLIPQIGLSFHQTLTHSTALFAAIAFFWFSLLRLERETRIGDYALLGIAIGIGGLAKYSFVPALAAALLAATLHTPLRSALFSRKAAISLIVALAIASPHLFWLLSRGADGIAVAHGRLIGETAHVQRILEGLPALFWATLSFLAPLGVAGLIAGKGRMAALSGARTVLLDAAMIALAGLCGAIIVFGISNFQERYAISFLYPAYLWLIVCLCRRGDFARTATTLLACSIIATTAFLSARSLESLRPGKPFCESCRQQIPYDYLRNALAAEIAEGDTLVGFDDHTAGNLRRLFPRARVISSHQPFYTPPVMPAGRCYFIWSTDLSPAPPQGVIAQFNSAALRQAGGVWRRRLSGEGVPRKTFWTIAVVNRATPFGADLCRN